MNDTKKAYHITGFAVFFVTFIVFLLTMSRSTSFWDCGEFIATSYILGIPHSPGTPLYVLVGRVFSLLPLPFSVAGKINFVSVLFGSLSATALYYLVVKCVQTYLGKPRNYADCVVQYGGAVVGAFFIAFSHTFWTNAIEAEVYALSAFLMASITLLALKWGENPEAPRSNFLLLLVVYLLAMGVGFHLGTVLAFSGVFFYFFFFRKKAVSNFEFFILAFGIFIFLGDTTIWRNGQLSLILLAGYVVLVIWAVSSESKFVGAASALFLLGISVHLYLYIRSQFNPAIDEADPENWDNLYAVLRREQYPPSKMTERKAPFSYQLLTHFGGYFLMQFEMFARKTAGGLLFGKIKAPHFSVAIPVGLGIIGIIEHFIREKKSFFLVFITLMATSLGLVIFLNFKVDEVRERDYFYSPAFYYFAVFIGIGAVTMLQLLRAGLRRPRQMATAVTLGAMVLIVMACLPARRHWFTHDRSNETIPVEYAQNMLVGLEKDAILFTNGDNDTFPLWYVQEVEHYRKDVRVVNLSLLNTPWYIKQLRDNEPKVPVSYSDEEIAALRPTIDRGSGQVTLVRDYAMNNIVLTNGWSGKPIYIAVTVPRTTAAPYRQFLEMEGLAFRLVPRKGENQMNKELIFENIWKRFTYGGILVPASLADEPEVIELDTNAYRDANTRGLIQNYAAAFAQLAYIYSNDPEWRDMNKAIRNLEVAKLITPDIEPVLVLLGTYYMQAGRHEDALSHYLDALERKPERNDLRYRLAAVYEKIGDFETCLKELDTIIRKDSHFHQAYQNKFIILVRLGRYQEAVLFAESYIRSHPEDKEMPKILERVKSEVLSTEQPQP